MELGVKWGQVKGCLKSGLTLFPPPLTPEGIMASVSTGGAQVSVIAGKPSVCPHPFFVLKLCSRVTK